jgi:RNA polymerase sigma-54 factor
MLNLTQRQTLQQKLTPAQVQYLKILQLPVLQLEQTIKDELEINPLLEEGMEQEEDLEFDTEAVIELRNNDNGEGDAPDLDALNVEAPTAPEDFIERSIQENREEEYSWDEFLDNNEGAATVNYYDSEDDYEIPTPAVVSMRERLLDQVRMLDLTEEEVLLVEAIIWNIDDDGYLRRSFTDIVEECNAQHEIEIDNEQAEAVLKRVQRLDPPGIASRNLRECLLTQLELLPNTSTARIIAIRILREAFELFSKKHFDRIMHQLHISEDLLRRAFDIIRGLNPKPGEGDGVDNINYIIPDFFVTRDDGEFVVQLNDRGVPPLRISRAYRQLMAQGRKNLSTEARTFLRQKMDAAKWFIQSIHQRRQTMYLVMWSIIEHQKEWFERGHGFLRPLVYKDIADDIGMDISTISRVVNGKYAQTEWGVFELRHFFSEGIVTDTGDEIANKEIMAMIREMIDKEHHRKPLSDQAITDVLQERGYVIARRTVAKYREAMDIPVSRLRKGLN